ncbi:MAG TPA: hypothetical protein VH917_04990 [Ignavibacteriaceae bacterium]|jgi:hypothetical protein
MNSLTKNILSVILFLFNYTVTSAQDCKAEVQFICDIENVLIVINDSVYGQGKLFQTQLEQGKYFVVISENSDRWDAKSFSDTLIVADCKTIVLDYKFRSEVLLKTDPQDVYVFENDSLIGFTPIFLTQAQKEIVLKKDGYADKHIFTNQLIESEPVKLDFTGVIQEESFMHSIWFKFLIGSLVALGATTAYYKLEADDLFDEYKITGDPELLEQTDKYDMISGVTFVALQINFALIAYFLLTGY